MTSFASALNILWALVSAGAAVYLLRRSDLGCGRARSAVAVLLAAVSLFPVVSASDDAIRFALFGERTLHTSSRAGAPLPDDPEKQPSSPLLARLLDSLDAAQISPYSSVAATFRPVAVVVVPKVEAQNRQPAPHFGRAPPPSA